MSDLPGWPQADLTASLAGSVGGAKGSLSQCCRHPVCRMSREHSLKVLQSHVKGGLVRSYLHRPEYGRADGIGERIRSFRTMPETECAGAICREQPGLRNKNNSNA